MQIKVQVAIEDCFKGRFQPQILIKTQVKPLNTGFKWRVLAPWNGNLHSN